MYYSLTPGPTAGTTSVAGTVIGVAGTTDFGAPWLVCAHDGGQSTVHVVYPNSDVPDVARYIGPVDNPHVAGGMPLLVFAVTT